MIPSLHLWAGAVLALGLAGCGGPPGLWNVSAIEARHPGVAEAGGHQLASLVPYVWPHEGELLWFTCRWPDATPVGVAYADAVSEREAEILDQVLTLWMSAVPGLQLARVDGDEDSDIRISVGDEREGYSGRTSAECRVDPASVVPGGEWLDARLLHAGVRLRRVDIDKLSRPTPLSEGEFLATAAHEIGHALGFQGHVAGIPSVMRAQVGRVRGMGDGLLEGDALQEPTLRALYAVPSGTVVARGSWPAERSAVVERLGALAVDEGFVGPTVRVGNRAARIGWWRRDGREVGVTLRPVRAGLRQGDALELEPDLVAQGMLGR